MRTLTDHELKRIRVAFGLYLGGLMKKAETDAQGLHASAKMSVEYINDMLCGVMIASLSAGKKIAKAIRLPSEEKLFWILIKTDYARMLDSSEAKIVASSFPELFPNLLSSESKESPDEKDSGKLEEARRDFLFLLRNLVQKKRKREKGQCLPGVSTSKKNFQIRSDSIFLGECYPFEVELPEGKVRVVIYRTRELRSGEPDLHRYVNCKAYGACLDGAIAMGWSGFSCMFCHHFMDPEMNFYKDSVEVSFGGFDFSECL